MVGGFDPHFFRWAFFRKEEEAVWTLEIGFGEHLPKWYEVFLTIEKYFLTSSFLGESITHGGGLRPPHFMMGFLQGKGRGRGRSDPWNRVWRALVKVV